MQGQCLRALSLFAACPSVYVCHARLHSHWSPLFGSIGQMPPSSPASLPSLMPWVLGLVLLVGSLSPTIARADGPLDCKLRFNMQGWSVFYKTAEGEGTVTCSNGERLPVRITSRGGGITFGKSSIDNGRGEFSGIYNIREVLGGYAAAEAHAGAGKSSKAQVVTKGSVSLALTGTGSGWDIGVSIGNFVLSER